ncbi:sulfite exporter TauE/SafE family protein [Sporomusa sp.]|uniref:sulfite exporter TauE/SafE family protein n=1 Tax=Sporomusa sp. TaxID=2078658 RepID=UPI002B7B4B6E|nr:sulfite exporter TauE/SafE family protein [Sporomusa sp.]HWR43076.1 sulfite exporter TauE/SafE family protein [Sporomusa sp.]
MSERAKLTGLGFVVGILSGLLGVGGGIFLVPIMVTYFNITQHIAQATSMAIVIPTALVSSAIYGFHGNIDVLLALNLILGSICGASLGARVMKRIPAIRLKQLFGVLLMLVGLRMVLA